MFPDEHCVFGDDQEMSGCEKKPAPDSFLLVKQRLDKVLIQKGETALQEDECLVFEDSIAGVEAGRRAAMRVVWVPHEGLARVCRGREQEVLMGITERDGTPVFEDEGEETGVASQDRVVSDVNDSGGLSLRRVQYPHSRKVT